MITFLLYLLKASLCLLGFYLLYKVFLSRETFFRFNRFILLGGMLLSALLPLMRVDTSFSSALRDGVLALEHWAVQVEDVTNERAATILSAPSRAGTEESMEEQPVVIFSLGDIIEKSAEQTGEAALVLPTEEQETVRDSRDPLLTPIVLVVIYFLGLAVCLVSLLVSLLRMTLLIRRGRCICRHPYTVIVVTEAITPFSFGPYIVLSETDYAHHPEEILVHEEMHARKRHSIDILISELFVLVFWFNPAVWLFKRELHDVHEYEADQAVIDSGVDGMQYQLLLVKKAVGAATYTLANSFNHSNIKNRITMMLRTRSNRRAGWKYLLLIPLAAMGLHVFAIPSEKELNESFTQAMGNGQVQAMKTVSDDSELWFSINTGADYLRNYRLRMDAEWDSYAMPDEDVPGLYSSSIGKDNGFLYYVRYFYVPARGRSWEVIYYTPLLTNEGRALTDQGLEVPNENIPLRYGSGVFVLNASDDAELAKEIRSLIDAARMKNPPSVTKILSSMEIEALRKSNLLLNMRSPRLLKYKQRMDDEMDAKGAIRLYSEVFSQWDYIYYRTELEWVIDGKDIKAFVHMPLLTDSGKALNEKGEEIEAPEEFRPIVSGITVPSNGAETPEILTSDYSELVEAVCQRLTGEPAETSDSSNRLRTDLKNYHIYRFITDMNKELGDDLYFSEVLLVDEYFFLCQYVKRMDGENKVMEVRYQPIRSNTGKLVTKDYREVESVFVPKTIVCGFSRPDATHTYQDIFRELSEMKSNLLERGVTADRSVIPADETSRYYYLLSVMNALAQEDLSRLWMDKNFLTYLESYVTTGKRREPLGYIGDDFQRFRIHSDSFTKLTDSWTYRVEGKTRVRENRCRFDGTLTITNFALFPGRYHDGFSELFRQGYLEGTYEFRENESDSGAGVLMGTFRTNFYIDANGMIQYDGLQQGVRDSFNNNQFEGTWTSYRTGEVKKCNWGDFRIPDSKGLDGGAGEFFPIDASGANGWLNYAKASYNNLDEAERGQAEQREQEEWWK